jgi:hypothetical protein
MNVVQTMLLDVLLPAEDWAEIIAWDSPEDT